MYIFDTLTKTKKKFTPIAPGKVGFYQCGPTMYWNQHIGNMRSVVLADFMNRSLQYLGNEVTFVRNYTDVGHLSGDNEGDADTGIDRMEKAAKRDGKKPNRFSETQAFPGWHIECSAMSKKYLGETFDIHMGGIEHIPIHHTNEIAQSESTHGKDFVSYWIHNEHLLVDNKKMSKSEGTSYLVQDIVDKGYSPLDLRYFFMQAHYRSKQNFTWDALESSKQARSKLSSKIASYADSGSVSDMYKNEFKKALEADFSLPEALSVTYSVLSSDLSDSDKKATILDFDSVLGLKLEQAEHANDGEISYMNLPENIIALVDERLTARAEKDWARSDEIRDQLAELGYEVKDTAVEQKVFKK